MSAALASLHNADIAVDCPEGSPPVVNTNHETVIARRAAQPVVETAAVVEQDYPSMGTENFSYYLDEIPGYYGRFDTRGPGSGYIPLHSPSSTSTKRCSTSGRSSSIV